MLSFATEFPVQRDQRSDQFIASIRKWLLGSPHTVFSDSDLSPMLLEAEWRIRNGNESVQILRCNALGNDSTGIRYLRSDSDLQWTTTAVFSATSTDAWVAIRVVCESLHPAVRLPPAKKPLVLRVLLEDLGGGYDGPLQLSETPQSLSASDIPLAAELILGRASCRLPVVYLSAGFHGDYVLDPQKLANDLIGLAHVVVEPDRAFSLRLKLEVASANVYGGTIGIYWPDGGGRRAFFIGGEYENTGEVAKAVFSEIRGALVNRRPMFRCTWGAVQEQASKAALEILRNSGSKSIEEYVENFDRDLNAKQEKLEYAEAEIQRLRNDLAVYEARQAVVGNLSLSTGAEQDLYPNEILAFLRDALEDSLDRVPTDSRRQHVLRALVDATPQLIESSARREKLKQLLRDFRGLDKNSRRELQALGFQISEEGKHVKLRFQGDDRYTFTLPKTGGDYRGGLNAASDIGRLLF